MWNATTLWERPPYPRMIRILPPGRRIPRMRRRVKKQPFQSFCLSTHPEKASALQEELFPRLPRRDGPEHQTLSLARTYRTELPIPTKGVSITKLNVPRLMAPQNFCSLLRSTPPLILWTPSQRYLCFLILQYVVHLMILILTIKNAILFDDSPNIPFVRFLIFFIWNSRMNWALQRHLQPAVYGAESPRLPHFPRRPLRAPSSRERKEKPTYTR